MEGICPDFDSNFNTSVAMITLVNIFGGIGVLTLLWQLWRKAGMVKYTDFAIFFFACCLFQGLTLLMLRSNTCNELNFFAYIPVVENITSQVETIDVFCKLEKGSLMTIIATVFWFISGLLGLFQGDP
mmetsp:Transcript_59279/g.176142  ORF Transcript_59279/g.176142 Transcript_59279/m.176142 type:complete len:128 (-) Transcript_59279:228-611(-)